MQQLTPAGQQIVTGLAQRYGFSTDAVTHMLVAVLNGNGSMAQFGHPEFGGSGQWMRGGMVMLGDMFNNNLKNSVDSLCNEIANVLANQPGLLQSGSFQSQSQGDSGGQQQSNGAPQGHSSLFVPDPARNWWPADLGAPSATGNQNTMRYAYFASARRLAVDTNGEVWIYDTLDHQIGGFSQQQGMGGGIQFGSQYGTVNLASLPVVSINGQQPVVPAPPSAPIQAAPEPTQAAVANPPPAVITQAASVSTGIADGTDIFAAIERLGGLFEKGILTQEEFTQKKAELLQRL